MLQTDASGVGLGAVIMQGEEDDQRLVQYISCKLFPRETRYSMVEKNALGIKWALDTLKYYLMKKYFVLESDHRALQWLHKIKEANTRITAIQLQREAQSWEGECIGQLSVTLY